MTQALTYKDKMAISKRLLELMRMRLTGKTSVVLPPEGQVTAQDPAEISLVGGLAPLPDPDYHREQPPCAMGMVLMVEPDTQGNVVVALNGRFDVTHRYIPSLLTMKEQVQVGADGERHQQKLPDCFKRFSVQFSDASFALDTAHLNQWSEHKLEPLMKSLHNVWETDPRIFRIGQVNDRGYINTTIPWGKDDCASNQDLADLVARNLFIGDSILMHDVRLRARLRPPPPNFAGTESRYLLELYLQNNTESLMGRAYGLLRPSLLDVWFEANLLSGRQFDVPHRLQPEDYRYQPEDGVAGYGVTCAVEKVSNLRFRTNSMPVFAQARVDAPSPKDVGMPLPASFQLLKDKPLDVLDGFLSALKNYGTIWDSVEAELEQAGKTAELDAVRRDRHDYDLEVRLIEDGIGLLRDHEGLRHCFSLMNETMKCAIELQGKSFDGWHLFQLGFILTQVRAVYERHALAHECKWVSKTADVLWFSTGGGKTEAYLGIIAFGMLYARLKGRLYGTTAWMRFPLRMLSAQQFQRLSYVVAQAEIVRCREGFKGHPFTVGYYTGSGTPGRISRSDVKGADIWLPEIDEDSLERYRFITDCPYCGQRGSVHMTRNIDKVRMLHRCNNPECWSNTKAKEGEYGEGIAGEIGIFVSDEECYRYIPTVLVGTVDKLAVIAHNERFAGYLGAFRHFCPEHGFTADAKCKHQRIRTVLQGNGYESTDCGNNSRTSKIKTVQLAPMLDPGFSFLIQDELHLLRESLGNFDAHYETLLQTLQVGHGGQASKVLAATATIKDFQNHTLHLYMRPGRRFPSPGALRGESFYARISREDDETLVRRWFAGVLPLSFTRGGTERAAGEVASRYQDQIDEWLEGLATKDPKVMEEIGIPFGKACLVLDYVSKYLTTDLIYANQKRQTTAIREHLDNVNARDGKARTHRLLDGQTPLDDILDAIHQVENKAPNDPMRHLVATSVVSHGVDIAELNFMVLDGWPRSTAEYIQSSARSGRVQPGIVMSILSSGKLFESGVFLNFDDYHFFLDKLVDSVPINRFAPNVMQRTLPGVFTAVILNWAKFQPGWGITLNRYASQLHKVLNDATSEARQRLREMLVRALDAPPDVMHEFDIRVLASFRKQLEDEVDRGLHRLQNLNAASADKDLGTALESIYQFPPMRSFRDIENQVEIVSAGLKEKRTMGALGR